MVSVGIADEVRVSVSAGRVVFDAGAAFFYFSNRSILIRALVCMINVLFFCCWSYSNSYSWL